MAVSFSTRKWLGSVALAGLILASSLPVSASTEPTADVSVLPAKPLLVASAKVSTDSYTQIVRSQLQWIANPTKSNVMVESTSTTEKTAPELSEPVVVAEDTTQPTNDGQSSEKAQPSTSKSNVKVQVAAEPKQQVSRSTSSDSSSTLVGNALSLTGVPYVFGGTSKSGFDCSGYTQYVFKGSGVSLPRTSSAQFNVGTEVKKDQLQAGDLVFFTTYSKGPSHVGIYIGSGKFVHASNSGVRTTSLNDSYYASRYVGARRVN